LDRNAIVHKAYGKTYKRPSSGDHVITFQHCRAIKEVWGTTSEERYQLEKKSIQDLLTKYADAPSTMDQGKPLFYSPALLRIIPEGDRITVEELESVVDYLDVIIGKHYDYNGVIFMPPSDGTYTLEVWGMFYSPELTSDLDESFWSVVHPSVLLMAAMRELEIVYRNTEGVRDWENSIKLELTGIDMDGIEEDIAELDQIEG